MQNGPQSARGTSLTTHAAWINNASAATIVCGNPFVDRLDWADAQAVAAARNAVEQMTAGRGVAGWASQGEREHEAVEAVTSIVLCQAAAIWAQENDGETPVDGLSQEDLQSAMVKLFSLLSPVGLRSMTARYEVVADGIRYFPNTGDAELDDLLGMVVSETVVSELRTITTAASEVLNLMEEHAQIWKKAEPVRNAAMNLIDEGWTLREAADYENSAIAMERAADTWAEADQSRVEVARAWDLAAMNWRAAGNYVRAAQLLEAAAEIYEGARQPSESATAYSHAAWTWGRAGEHDRAAQVHEKEAVAWQLAHQFESAAEAWQSAGAPDQAARDWRQALRDAVGRPDTVAQITANAARLFRFDIEHEEAQG